jgi:hypothetical protein
MNSEGKTSEKWIVDQKGTDARILVEHGREVVGWDGCLHPEDAELIVNQHNASPDAERPTDSQLESVRKLVGSGRLNFEESQGILTLLDDDDAYQAVKVLIRAIREYQGKLADCYIWTGEDPDGNEQWRLADHAVEAVRNLRKEFDALQSKLAKRQK